MSGQTLDGHPLPRWEPGAHLDSLWLYHKNKSVIGAQQSVPTGPVVIDQNNIGDILDGVKAGLR